MIPDLFLKSRHCEPRGPLPIGSVAGQCSRAVRVLPGGIHTPVSKVGHRQSSPQISVSTINANGAFETDVYAPSAFAPLPGPTYICRVLTPYTGIPQAQRSVTISVSPDFKTRPVNAVSLAVP